MIDRWPQHAHRQHVVYRAYDAEGHLLYVGCTLDFERRRREHERSRPWAADVSRWDTVAYACQADALAAEERAIRSESPLHNAMYNGSGLTGWNEQRQAAETCLHGHLWSENADVNSQGRRICRACKRDHGARHDRKRRLSPTGDEAQAS